MLRISIKCTRFKINYNSFTSKSGENICINSGGAKRKKERQGETQFTTKTEFPLPLTDNVFFVEISPYL
jgi:hypothetical protein